MGTEEVAIKEESGEISDLEQKVIRQIEYYFGNYNLSKDKFLREQLKEDEGWIPLELMVKFNRLKQITEDYDVICKALKKSPSGLMEVDEESKKIRRTVERPLPENAAANREEQEARTVYVKGFRKNNTLDELLDYFKGHKVENVFMRRNKLQKNAFKGSCFVLFETKEDAENFLAKKELKYENTELLKETRKDYIKRKDIYYANLKEERAAKKALNKKTSNDETKEDDGKKAERKNIKELELIPGCLIKICGLGKECLREDIKPLFENFGTIAYIDYNRGKPEAYIRYETAVAANVIKEVAEEDGQKIMEIAGSKATISALEGDEEKEYWKNIAINKANARQFCNSMRQNKGRFNKNNKNWGRKRNYRDGDSGDQRPHKKQKWDSNDKEKDEGTVKKEAVEETPMKEEA